MAFKLPIAALGAKAQQNEQQLYRAKAEKRLKAICRLCSACTYVVLSYHHVGMTAVCMLALSQAGDWVPKLDWQGSAAIALPVFHIIDCVPFVFLAARFARLYDRHDDPGEGTICGVCIFVGAVGFFCAALQKFLYYRNWKMFSGVRVIFGFGLELPGLALNVLQAVDTLVVLVTVIVFSETGRLHHICAKACPETLKACPEALIRG